QWLDGSGKVQPLLTTPGSYSVPRLSPEGRRLSFIGDSVDVYVRELERETTTRLTFAGRADGQVWAPDGKHLVFGSSGNGCFWVRSDGSGDPYPLLKGPNRMYPTSFSPEGRRLVYHELNPDTGFDIWTLPLDLSDPDRPKAGQAEPFLRTSS